ncbi:MAG TPA: D-alanine--D-alanine ligase [Chitinophagaceae bacterium]|nr:D-alanine--D-alanine ligase [Chitinophagaceae bacterium]
MENKRKQIALLGGGYSGEETISLKSLETVYQNLNKSVYDVHKLIINQKGWFYITNDEAQVAIDKNDFSVTLDGHKITFDLVFILIHGSPGEDGKLQGYFEMLDIPFTTGDSISSALTFNKYYCNQVVKNSGIVAIANSVYLNQEKPYSLGMIMSDLQLPVFVKPNESGSSLGISKVQKPGELLTAVDLAFKEDTFIIIEEFIEGRELTIGVYEKNGEVLTLPPTEILTKNEFFDFEAKYTPGLTDEITPADISQELNIELAEKAKDIYGLLNCKGLVRMDFIYHKEKSVLYFLEVNTVPGQTATSLVPQQVEVAGISLSDFYKGLVEEALK